MKKNWILLTLLVSLVTISCSAQSWKELQEAAKKVLPEEGKSNGATGLSNGEVVNGLKEALKIGAEKAVSSAAKTNGFNGNSLIRIPFPEEAKEVKDFALKIGMESQVNQFETTLNQAAEKASAEATQVLVNAIVNMSVQDGFAILNGGDTAATHYLRKSTTAELTQKFTPIVERAINEVNLTKYWTPLTSAYNKNPFKPKEINTDLTSYVTKKALDGLFLLISQEEKSIRENPQARVTDLLKKVFGS